MPVFPSLEWFQALREAVNQDEEYRHFGTCDAVMGVKVDDRIFAVLAANPCGRGRRFG